MKVPRGNLVLRKQNGYSLLGISIFSSRDQSPLVNFTNPRQKYSQRVFKFTWKHGGMQPNITYGKKTYRTKKKLIYQESFFHKFRWVTPQCIWLVGCTPSRFLFFLLIVCTPPDIWFTGVHPSGNFDPLRGSETVSFHGLLDFRLLCLLAFRF